MTAVDARLDPTAASSAAAAVLGATHDEADPPPAPETSDTTVDLPGGIYDPITRTSTTQAEVRELDGEDEEAILRVNGDLSKVLDTILVRGVASVGDEKATKDVLDTLLVADRVALLIGIRRATFGDDIELVNVRCPGCGDEQGAKISCSRDIPVERLDSPADRWFTVETPSGRKVECALPDGSTHRALAESKDTSPGALNTILLANCVEKIDGFPAVGAEQVRKLSWKDRDAIRAEIEKRSPGPRLSEVKRPCSACGDDIPLPLSLVDLFRL